MSDTITEDNEETQEDQSLHTDLLITHDSINHALCGDIKTLDRGYAEVVLTTTQEMAVDDMGLIHGGFVFGAADFAAMAAVNETNVVLATSNCQFLAPIKVGDIVIFKAKVQQKDGRKRNVEVEAFSYGVKIFTGLFRAVITERHVLKLKLLQKEE